MMGNRRGRENEGEGESTRGDNWQAEQTCLAVRSNRLDTKVNSAYVAEQAKVTETTN